jgi:hypothetical protein
MRRSVPTPLTTRRPPPPAPAPAPQEDAVTPGFAVLLMYALLLLILGAQTGLVIWKQKHKRSYELVRLPGAGRGGWARRAALAAAPQQASTAAGGPPRVRAPPRPP